MTRILLALLTLSLLTTGCGKPDGHPSQTHRSAAFDPLAYGPREAPPNAELPPLEVIDYAPRGEEVGTRNVGQIRVRFNRAVRPMTGAAEQAAPGLLTLHDENGPVAGEAYFKTPQLLVFETKAPLPPAHRYTARLAGDVTTQDGSSIGTPLEWTFATDRPSLQLIEPATGAVQVDREAPLFLRTRMATDVDELRPHLSLRVADREAPISVRAATDEELETFWHTGDERIVRVKADQPFPVGAEVTLEVSPGWTSNAGPLPTTETYEASFRVHPRLTVEEFSCPTSACALQAIEVRFSTMVPSDQASRIDIRPRPKNLEISPTLWTRDDDEDGPDETQSFWIDGHLLPDVDYEITVDSRLTDVFGQTLGKEERHRVEFEMPPPELYLTRDRGTVVDDGEPHVGISSRHMTRVRIRAVKVPAERYRELYLADQLDSDLPALKSLGRVAEKVVDVTPIPPTEWASTPLKLDTLLGDWRGPVAIEVVPEEMTAEYRDWRPSGDRGIFQFTSLAPVFVRSLAGSVVRVEDLAARKPASGIRISVSGPDADTLLGTTDADGLLRLEGQAAAVWDRDLLTARADDGETVVTPLHTPPRGDSWARPGERVHGKLVAERGAYRPGEEVWVVGWAALRTPHDRFGFTSLPPGTRATLQLVDNAGTALAEETVDIRDGKLWAKLDIPRSARLGHARVVARFANDAGEAPELLSTSLRIEEYRVPTFEVQARVAEDELVADQKTQLHVSAHYFTGGPIVFADLRVRRSCWQVGPTSPTGWRVGMPRDVWGYGSSRIPIPASKAPRRGEVQVEVGGLGAATGHTRRCAFSTVVQNAAFQEEGASATVLVHPGPYYLGMRKPEDAPEPGDDFTVDVASFDHDGKRSAVDAPVEVVVTRTVHKPVWSRRGKRRWISRYEEESEEWTRCTVRLREGAASCPLGTLKDGTYEVTATATDDSRVRSSMTVGVGDSRLWQADEEDPFITLRAPGRLTTPGEPIELEIDVDDDVSGIVVAERYGIREVHPFQTRRGSAAVTVTGDASWAPVMHFRAFVIDTTGERPTLATADASVDVDAEPRKLTVQVEAPETATIRQTIPVTVRVDDADGPVNGRVAIWAVDEAVLGLTNYEVPDVVDTFLPRNVTGDLSTYDGLDAFLPLFEPQRYDPYRGVMHGFGSGSGFGMGGVGRGGGGSAASPRTDFETTPFFLGDAAVEDGVAQATFDLPDNMTAYRIIAVASATLHDETTPMRFGHSSTRLTVTAPLIARPALPRFTRPGDSPELGVVVDNQSQKAGTLSVEMQLDGEALAWADGVDARHEQEVSGAADQVRVAFAARAVAPGTTSVTIATRLTPDDGSPALQDVVRVPLRTDPEPTIVETVATYGTVDDDATVGLPVKPPGDVLGDYGGVQVTVSSTLLGGLRDATRELVHYPYGCVEQTSSRMLPLVALSDLRHFVEAVEIPNGETVESFVDDGVTRILSMQQPDGGFSYWPGSGPSNAYASAYATWVLQLARDAGHRVPKARIDHALDYLTTVTEHPDEDWPDSVIYYQDLRRAIAVHVLARDGRTPQNAIDRLFDRRENLPVFATAFLALAMYETSPDDPRLATLERALTNTITEQPGTAHVVETPRYDLGEYFHSDLRSSAIAMMALLRLRPEHPLNAKLARGLMQKRYRGAWRNTQENAYALVAMADYARRYEKVEPNFRFRVWTDHAVLLDDRWMGRSSKSRTGRLPMAETVSLAARAPSGTVPLNIRRQGAGRAYYRLAMTYAPQASDVEAIARGIDVRREFRREGKPPADVPPSHVTAGEVIAIDVELHTKSLSRYVAVDIPLPAGLEGVNLSLGGPKVLPMHGVRGWWVSHSEYHDDRIVLFADTLHPGTHRHTIYVRATTVGDFVFPPTTAKAMYTPEVFGRTDGGSLTVRSR